ncbi:branched-chain amino acid transporter permease [Corynebacterium timonense]|uniref:Branched-chain amino acid transport protein AzlD n=1 Tax=Corynebacterium timonense TaxID=441500 RepID=A0A1H1UGR5_9CORY|nr:AzlD domain-containing protein [Corynebacterium timonense]SDS71628.1 Branched-chain amino acid transport protein AzlD [Corynebacterium timonense]
MGLPVGVSLAAVAAVLIPVGLVTLLLRALPFPFLRLFKGSPLTEFLGVYMPVGVMTVLVVYTLLDASALPGGIAAGLLAVAVTLGVHAWRRSAALSVVAGTVFYMVLVNLVF